MKAIAIIGIILVSTLVVQSFGYGVLNRENNASDDLAILEEPLDSKDRHITKRDAQDVRNVADLLTAINDGVIDIIQNSIPPKLELGKSIGNMTNRIIQIGARGLPQGMPQGTPQSTPQSLPQSTPQGTPQGTPQNTLQGTPQGSPENTPKGTPQDTPDRTQQGLVQALLQGLLQGWP